MHLDWYTVSSSCTLRGTPGSESHMRTGLNGMDRNGKTIEASDQADLVFQGACTLRLPGIRGF